MAAQRNPPRDMSNDVMQRESSDDDEEELLPLSQRILLRNKGLSTCPSPLRCVQSSPGVMKHAPEDCSDDATLPVFQSKASFFISADDIVDKSEICDASKNISIQRASHRLCENTSISIAGDTCRQHWRQLRCDDTTRDACDVIVVTGGRISPDVPPQEFRSVVSRKSPKPLSWSVSPPDADYSCSDELPSLTEDNQTAPRVGEESTLMPCDAAFGSVKHKPLITRGVTKSLTECPRVSVVRCRNTRTADT